MKKIGFEDLMSLEDYEQARDDLRRKVIDIKRRRRVQVGPRVSLLFENRDTVLLQVQEMLRTDRITQHERVQEELDTYNQLIPGDDELSATLFLEFEDSSRLPQELPRFTGIETSVSLRVGEHTAEGVPDEIRSKEEITSTIHYLRFRLGPEMRRALGNGGSKAFLVVAHPNYSQMAQIESATREELAGDLN
jgi:hypothetical protein